MYPTLIEWGDLRFHSYTVMMTLAFVIGVLGPNWLNNRRTHPFPISPAGGIFIFFTGIAGAKIYWAIQYGDASDWHHLQFVLTGGLVFFGGLFGGIIGGIIYLKYVKAPLLPVADMVAPFMALAHGIGRVGCFLNGCCWGQLMKMDLPWGAMYPRARYGPYRQQIMDGLISSKDVRSLPVHPTQIYETLGNVIIFILLLIVYKRHKRTGIVALSYFILYGVLRFITEAFRGESAYSVQGLTVSQTIGLTMFLGGGLTLLLLKLTLWKGPAPEPESELPAEERESEEPEQTSSKSVTPDSQDNA
ncbi:MAG: prolipoprotein diacylglyceryl transferase [Candidatus Hydrogenedentes bacterium]|nr:prolipoprotein diacylglyceryl transferase [Candidatus Hydrogenedentota bacterium]